MMHVVMQMLQELYREVVHVGVEEKGSSKEEVNKAGPRQ
jgi:hypothetical protein